MTAPRPRARAKLRAAMAADVAERAQRAIGGARHQYRLARDLAGQITARVGNGSSEPHRLPAAAEDAAPLGFEHGRVRVPCGRNRTCARQVRLPVEFVGMHKVGLHYRINGSRGHKCRTNRYRAETSSRPASAVLPPSRSSGPSWCAARAMRNSEGRVDRLWRTRYAGDGESSHRLRQRGDRRHGGRLRRPHGRVHSQDEDP